MFHMATKAEVEFWKDMNRKLTVIIDRQRDTYTAVMGKVYARGEELKSLQAMVDGLEWQVEDLQTENARLRSELESVGTAAYLYGRSDLADENAKLRELARGLGQCAQGVDCEDCQLYDLSEPDHCREERLWRELGMEVVSV